MKTKKKLKKMTTSLHLGMTSPLEYMTGKVDYKKHQVRPVEAGWSTPRAERKRAIADAIEREVYMKVSGALEEIHRQISMLCEEYDYLQHKEDDEAIAANAEEENRQAAVLRSVRSARESRLEDIRRMLAEQREESIAWDMVLIERLERIEARMIKVLTSYWRGVLSCDAQHEVGLMPVVKKSKAFPEEEHYCRNKERIEHMLEQVLGMYTKEEHIRGAA